MFLLNKKCYYPSIDSAKDLIMLQHIFAFARRPKLHNSHSRGFVYTPLSSLAKVEVHGCLMTQVEETKIA